MVESQAHHVMSAMAIHWPKINGELGLVHLYKWSCGPVLISGFPERPNTN